ncbi:hypothetical protein BH09PSE5_BH09PSE5_05570 [soil metagenome]
MPRIPPTSPPQLDIGVRPGNTAARADELARSRLIFTRGTEVLEQRVVGCQSGSAHLDRLTLRIGEKKLANMLARNAKAQRIMSRVDVAHEYALRAEAVLRRLGADGSPQSTRLVIALAQVGNSFAPKESKVNLIDPSQLPYAAHELRHGFDHTTEKMDLNRPEHRLASELNAFGSQQQTADELGVASGITRTPLQQARTYEGKDDVNYPGTVESSQAAVRVWKAGRV